MKVIAAFRFRTADRLRLKPVPKGRRCLARQVTVRQAMARQSASRHVQAAMPLCHCTIFRCIPLRKC